MSDLLMGLTTGCVVFAATNIDDIFLLSVLFTQAKTKTEEIQVVAGQYIGIVILIALSIAGKLGTQSIPKEWIGLLGVIPIYMGVKKRLSSGNTLSPHHSHRVILSTNTWKVAFVTIGNGADNLSVYTPLFVSGTSLSNLTVIVVFLILTGVWCIAAYQVVWRPSVRVWIQKHDRTVVPLVLIGIGTYILVDNHVIKILTDNPAWKSLLQVFIHSRNPIGIPMV